MQKKIEKEDQTRLVFIFDNRLEVTSKIDVPQAMIILKFGF